MSIIAHDGKIVSAGGKGLTFDSLIALANATTGEDDKTLAAAVERLIDGYGSGGGITPQLLCTLAQDMTLRTLLADFPIPIPEGFTTGYCFLWQTGTNIAASGTATPLTWFFSIVDGTKKVAMLRGSVSGLVSPDSITVESNLSGRFLPTDFLNSSYFNITNGEIKNSSLTDDVRYHAAGNEMSYAWIPIDLSKGATA